MDRHEEFLNSRRFVPFLKSRLFVAMADDYAVYKLASFKKAMRDLRTIKVSRSWRLLNRSLMRDISTLSGPMRKSKLLWIQLLHETVLQ